MTEPNSIVTAGIGDLFPFVVFVIIIVAQLIKKAQREGSGRAKAGMQKQRPAHPPSAAPRPQAPATPTRPADDELRNFLEQLAGTQQPRPRSDAPVQVSVQPRRPVQPPPPPIPKSLRPRQAVTHDAVAKTRGPRPVAKREEWEAARVHQPAETAGVAGVAGVAKVADVPEWGRRRKSASASSSLRRGLKKKASLRDAIVLREILGPPLALTSDELPRK